MSESDRFMIMAFTEPHHEREIFESWPQHITVMPWMKGFRLQAANRIADALSADGPLPVTVDGEAYFGGSNDIPVWTIAPNLRLQQIHQAILAAANKNGTVLEEDLYTGNNYHPHITNKAGQPEHFVGEELEISHLSIVGKHGIGKVIFRNIEL